MRRAIAALLAFLLAVPIAADAEPVAFAFAPPIGTTLRYESIREGTIGARSSGARFVRDYRFERDGDGYLLWVELRAIEPIGSEEAARVVEAVAAPMLDVRYAIEIGADGEPGAIRGQAGVWQRILEGADRIEAHNESRTDSTEGEREQMRFVLAGMRSRDPAGQRDDLLIVVRDLLAFAGRTIDDGDASARPLSSPLPVAGTVSASIVGDDMALVEIHARAPGQDEVVVVDDFQYRAAPSSGLVHAMERTRRIGQENADPGAVFVERQSFRLLEESASPAPAPTDAE